LWVVLFERTEVEQEDFPVTTEDAYGYMQEGPDRPNGWLQESAGDEEQTDFAVYCVICKFMPAARTTGVANFGLNRAHFKKRIMEPFGMTKSAVEKHISTKDFLKKLVAMPPELRAAAASYDYDDKGALQPWAVVSSNGNAGGGGDQTDYADGGNTCSPGVNKNEASCSGREKGSGRQVAGCCAAAVHGVGSGIAARQR
jgi:hypothetical protein